MTTSQRDDAVATQHPTGPLSRLHHGLDGLRQDLALLEIAMDHGGGAADIYEVPDPREANELALELFLGASYTRGLDPLLCPPVPPGEFDGLDFATQDEELHHLRSGRVTVLMVVTPQGSLRTPRYRDYQCAITRAGERTRFVPSLPNRMSIFEDHTAMLGRPGGQRGALVVRNRQLVSVLTEYFDGVYAHARDWHPDHLDNDPDLRVRVTELMTQGLVDDAIARRLQTSTRTVARVVSALMRENDCSTRFQLGLALAAQDLVRSASGTTPAHQQQ